MEKKRMSLLMLLGFIPFLLAFTFGGEIRFDQPTKLQVDSRCGNDQFIDIAAEELRAKYMRGYGELDEQTIANLEEISSALQTMVKDLKKDLNE